MIKLTKRQLNILEFIRKSGGAGNQEIGREIKGVSHATIVRDLRILLNNDLIEQKGKGRSVYYQEKTKSDFLRYIDLDKYFEKETDERRLKFSGFNFDIFRDIKDIFISQEIKELKNINNRYRDKIKILSKGALKKEFERLTIELSWKSSKIEGNTYSLIDTEILIKEQKEAAGHKREEAIMILNHKNALDYISGQRSDFKRITISKIENIHNLIINGLGIESGLRKSQVRIIGTQYLPLDNQHQIREAMEKAAKKINNFKDPFSKALFAIIAISYIQPFIDGNKRTSRLVGNALLMANNICPLSFRSVDETEYKKSMIVFYEQNNLRAFKDLFVEQFKFAVENYF
ncbi:Fic family protein [Patescibacteria group bacterium]|nr:Fic family protein [Patescibacteria group bacterium]